MAKDTPSLGWNTQLGAELSAKFPNRRIEAYDCKKKKKKSGYDSISASNGHV